MPWAPSYATAAELQQFVRIDDSADDTVINLALDAASRMIDFACDPSPGHSRQFGKTATAEDRYFTATERGYGPSVRGQWVARLDDLASVVGLVVAVAASAGAESYTPVTGTAALPRNAVALGRPFTEILFAGSSYPSPPLLADAVRVTGVWGWPAVPGPIHEACLLQASRLLARRDAPFGVAGSAEVGSEVRLLAKVDPDVETMLRPYVRALGPVLA
jgi:hypothetical protein